MRPVDWLCVARNGQRRWQFVCLLAVLMFVAGAGCNLTHLATAPTATPAVPDPVLAGDVWEFASPGVAFRQIRQPLTETYTPVVWAVRIDPLQAQFRVHYSPGTAFSVIEWDSHLPDAEVIVNAAFFDPDHTALGLVVSDGIVHGTSFQGFGGMFQVDGAGHVRVCSLVTEPYAGEALQQAVQGFPVLIEAGGQRAPSGDGFDARSLRTVVGQDLHGNIVFVVFYSPISLSEVQDWLLASDLGLTVAFGLDGGGSTGLVIRRSSGKVRLPSFDRVPSVIAVYN